eukprot:3901742-Ditylum_brightwellii.AAC.1
MRKLRYVYSNVYLASVHSLASSVSLGGLQSKLHLVTCSTQSLWFEKFAIGCRSLMGEIVRQDWATSIKELLTFLDVAEELVQSATSHEEQRSCILMGAFAAIAYAGSFRRPELFLAYLHGLRSHQTEGSTGTINEQHAVVVLLGRFKGKSG